MTHHHDHSGGHDHEHNGKGGRSLLKDWRTWLAVVLMLGAMVTYVVTQDDSIVPRGPAPASQGIGATAPSR